VTHCLDDVAEQQTREGCQLTLGQDELLPQRRYRGEIAAGQLVEKSDPAAILTAKLSDPLSQRSHRVEAARRHAEHRQQAVNENGHAEFVRIVLRIGIQTAGCRVEDGGLMS
jgi:hypothetical protein